MVNVPPLTAGSFSATTPDGVPLELEFSDYEWVSVGNAQHGSLYVHSHSVTYTPNVPYVGSDSFSYTLHDSWGSTMPAEVRINVTPPPLSAQPFSETVADGTSIQVSFLNHDGSVGQPVWLSSINDQAVSRGANNFFVNTPHGSIYVLDSHSFTYTPNGQYSGSDSFTYMLSDSWAETSPARVQLQVTQPVLTAQPFSSTLTDGGSAQVNLFNHIATSRAAGVGHVDRRAADFGRFGSRDDPDRPRVPAPREQPLLYLHAQRPCVWT